MKNEGGSNVKVFQNAKRNWPAYVAIIVGIIVAFFAWKALNGQVQKTQARISIVVPKEDIDAFSVVSPEKLVVKEVLGISTDKHTAQKLNEVAGMLTTAPLYAGKPIDMRCLVKPNEDIGKYEVVGVNIDAARAAGVKTGDIVDVYWLNSDQGTWTPAQASQLIASNVRVLRVCDEHGQPIDDNSKTIQGAVNYVVTPEREPKIVYLLVKPEDVPLIIGGSATKSASIALTRKSSETFTNGGVNGNVSLEQRETAAGTGASSNGTANSQPGGSSQTAAGASGIAKQ